MIQMSNKPVLEFSDGFQHVCYMGMARAMHGDDRGYEFIIAGIFQNLDVVGVYLRLLETKRLLERSFLPEEHAFHF